MIIAVEGNVHSGKTTFIKKFLQKNHEFVAVNESVFDDSLGEYERQLFYIDQERQKKQKFDHETYLIQDRSILSVLCYTLFMNTISNLQKQELINIILDGIDRKQFIIPDKIYYVSCNYETIANNHKVLKAKKHTQDILATNNYIDFYNAQFAIWLGKCVKEAEFNDGNRVIEVYNTEHLFENFNV